MGEMSSDSFREEFSGGEYFTGKCLGEGSGVQDCKYTV